MSSYCVATSAWCCGQRRASLHAADAAADNGRRPRRDALFKRRRICARMAATRRTTGVAMLDRDGYRPNVAIVVANSKNLVFWGKRIREHSWQFPQGGINPGETPEQAMYRELKEEVGLEPDARQDPRPHARLAALRGAAALDQARMARQLPRPEADLVPAAPDRPRQRRVVCARPSIPNSTPGAGTTTGFRWRASSSSSATSIAAG